MACNKKTFLLIWRLVWDRTHRFSSGSFGSIVIKVVEIIGIVTIRFRSASQMLRPLLRLVLLAVPLKLSLRVLPSNNLLSFGRMALGILSLNSSSSSYSSYGDPGVASIFLWGLENPFYSSDLTGLGGSSSVSWLVLTFWCWASASKWFEGTLNCGVICKVSE